MAVVLIVEDEVFIQKNAEWLLQDMGHSILLATAAEGAFALLSTPDPIDALFVDIRLGREPRAGYDIADFAVAARPSLRVLYTSGSPLCAAVSDGFVPGGRFLQKPYSSEQLEIAITDLLAPVSPLL